MFIYPGLNKFSTPMLLNNFTKFDTITLHAVAFLETPNLDCKDFLKALMITSISELMNGYLDCNCQISSFE